MNNNKQDREFVSVLGLIFWLIDKECTQTSDIFEACNRVSDTIVNQFVKNKYLNFYRLNIGRNNSSAMDQTRLPSVILPVSDFLKNIQSRNFARFDNRYTKALREIDTVLAKPLDQNFSISSVDVTPNYHFYSELQRIVTTFRYNLSDVDLIKFYLTSLLRRGGNPFIYKSTLLTLNEFEDISFSATSYSESVYFPCFTKENDRERFAKQGTNAISPNDLTVLRNQNLLIENDKLKAELLKKDEEINKLQQHQKTPEYINSLNNLLNESKKDSKIKKQEEDIKRLNLWNEQFSIEITNLKNRLAIRSKFEKHTEEQKILTPEQELPNSKTRNKVSILIAVLCELNKLDITKPQGKPNQLILDQASKLKAPLGKDFVGTWLKLAKENIE